MLPYLDQANVYDQCNFSLGASGNTGDLSQANTTAKLAVVRSFLCPSDSIKVFRNGTNYAGSMGTQLKLVFDTTPVALDPDTANNDGMFFRNVAVKIKDVADGTSKTIAFAEFLTGDNDGTRLTISRDVYRPGPTYGTDTQAFKRVAASAANTAAFDTWMNNVCKPKAAQNTSSDNAAGDSWARGQITKTLFNTVLTPNSTSANCFAQDDQTNGPHFNTCFGARSEHSGGVNVTLVDGSVTFVSDSIDRDQWFAMGTRNGGDNLK